MDIEDKPPTQTSGDKHPTGFHHRLYPHMDHLVQYASETDETPWIVRDRGTALRNERTGRGRALVRTWIPGSWEYVNVDPYENP